MHVSALHAAASSVAQSEGKRAELASSQWATETGGRREREPEELTGSWRGADGGTGAFKNENQGKWEREERDRKREGRSTMKRTWEEDETQDVKERKRSDAREG